MANRFWKHYSGWIRRLDWVLTIISIALFVVSIHYVRQFRIESDFKEMLPDQYQSVVQLDRIEERVKNTTTLTLLVGGDDWPAMRRFIDDFQKTGQEKMSDIVDRIDVNSHDVKAFFEKNKYLYADLGDLEEIYKRLKRQIEYEKISQSPLYIEFSDEKPTFDISDIEAKYRAKTNNYQNFREGYFTDEKAEIAAIIIRPKEGSTNSKFAKILIDRCQKVIDEMNPSSYHPSIKTAFGGRYQKMIDQYQSLVDDIVRSGILVLSMVCGVVFLYFRRIRMTALMGLTATLGTVIALAIAYNVIGYLTSQTAFLGSIIVGNGINYSLILLSRYLEEKRERGLSVDESLWVSLDQTWKATLVSSITTCVAFSALMVTEIKGFSQFGFIGSIGIFFCWISTYLFTPAWLSLSERVWPLKVKNSGEQKGFLVMGVVSRFAVSRYTELIRVAIGITVVSVIAMLIYIPHSIEYDFSKLKFKPVQREETWADQARERMNSIFGQSSTPAVVLADEARQVELICAAIEKKASVQAGGVADANLIDSCKTLYRYVPEHQDEKLKILSDIRGLLDDSTLKFLNEDQKKEVDEFQKTFNLKPVVLSDVPKEIVSNFEEVNGKVGLIVYVYPKTTANLWNGRELIKFADLITKVNLDNDEVVYSSGESAIFADLLRALIEQGPKVTLLSLALVIVVVILNFRNVRASLIVVGSLLLGILWLIGVLGIFNIKLNFLNFVAFPIAFGIGVDYAVNIYQRYVQDGPGSMENVLKTLGGAVLLCSMTTMIGYIVIITSRNQGLQSFGIVSLISEFATLGAAAIALPAFVTWYEKNRRGK